MKRKKNKNKQNQIRINESIFAKELRVIDNEGNNLGIMSLQDALDEARKRKLDLIEISPNANPPVAKIADYGKYKYELKKKAREKKAHAHKTETKVLQVKMGTGESDLLRKAKQAAEFLKDGQRVKIDLYLFGRYKAMDENFLKERLNKFLAIIPESFKIADNIKKSPKGFSVTIEKPKNN